MEDAHITKDGGVPQPGFSEEADVKIFAVFDGHGGEWCAQFVKERFENEMRKNLLDPIEGIYGRDRDKFNLCVKKALDKTFTNLDEEY